MSRPRRPLTARTGLFLTCVLATGALAGCLKVPTDGTDEPGADKAPASAQEVLGRFILALGGEPKLREITQRTVEARMTFLPETGCTDADADCRREEKIGNFTLSTTTAPRLYRRTVIENQIEEQGYDGKQGWQYRGGVLVLEDAEESAISREDANLHWYLDLGKRDVKIALEPARTTDHEGQPRVLDGVRWTLKDAQEKVLWFDRSTGLLREEVLEEKVNDQVLKQYVLYDDYRPIDGVQVAHKIRLINQVDKRAQEVVFTTQRVDHQPVPEETFVVPKVPAPQRAKDAVLEALTAARETAAAAPKDKDAQLVLARAAWAAAHFDEAGKAAEATLKLDPKESEALWILARYRVLTASYKDAEGLLTRAEKAGVRPELVTAQRAWIRSHTRDFVGVARALDQLGPQNAALASRYRTFVGKPLVVKMAGDGCQTELPVVREANTPPLIEVELAGEKTLALIDTGAADVIVDTELAAKLKLPIRSRTPLGEQGEIGHSQVPALKIGGATITDIPVDVFPSETLAQMSGGRTRLAGAVIGVRVLEQFQATLDVPAKKFSLVHGVPKCKAELAANRSGAGATPMWLHETNFVYVLGQMNGAEGLFLINTGMQGVDMTATSKAYARSGIGPPALRRDQPAIVDVAEFTIDELLTAEKLRGAYGYFEQGESSDQFRIDGMIGLEIITTRRVTFDFPERKLYFRDSAGPAAAKPPAAPTATPAAAPAKPVK
ncbi:MAG: retropepsin-like domain-containing protein [Myxococcales bacterium]|nr:retropepsin-like domain-containing protein [Myxococcales bacterium]